jgi:hypothetical protein
MPEERYTSLEIHHMKIVVGKPEGKRALGRIRHKGSITN